LYGRGLAAYCRSDDALFLFNPRRSSFWDQHDVRLAMCGHFAVAATFASLVPGQKQVLAMSQTAL
jgi:hypothetical protein